MSEPVVSQRMRKNFENIHAHYDLSDDFFAFFQDPSRIYSCAYFEPDDLSLEQAQYAKVDLHLDRLDLEPGMTVLDIGCGWGSTLKRAIERHDVNVVGLTLSRNQHAASVKLLDQVDTERSRRILLCGWEEFDEPVDRIVSIGAFEAFKKERYGAFFDKAYRILPGDGRMLLHTILAHTQKFFRDNEIKLTISDLKFMKFIGDEIFPGGQLPAREDIEKLADDSGFALARSHLLRPHYARTLDMWAKNLETNKAEAIAITSDEVYERYMRYLTGCADFFRRGITNIGQFTLVK